MKKINNNLSFTDKKCSIVLIDDNLELVILFKEILEKNGYKVWGFTNPEIALEFIRNNLTKCNLVISDYQLPHLNGYELGKKIKEIDKNIKMILVSNYEDSHENKSEFKFIQKPITIDNLIETIEESRLTIENQKQLKKQY
ncbi:MAG TPA: response regulator [Nitrososphaeraceae archaeon]|jgi:DNA-binding NtrC family response regulator|nr:response regulator [Nitrososphaeraceae archaeon]